MGHASIGGMEVQIVMSKTCMLDIVMCSEGNIIITAMHGRSPSLGALCTTSELGKPTL